MRKAVIDQRTEIPDTHFSLVKLLTLSHLKKGLLFSSTLALPCIHLK